MSRSRFAITKTEIKTKKLPKLEAMIVPNEERKNSDSEMGNNEAPKMTIATPKLAPELNPKTHGPASGFLNSVCINKPLTDNPIPINIATIALGNL